MGSQAMWALSRVYRALFEHEGSSSSASDCGSGAAPPGASGSSQVGREETSCEEPATRSPSAVRDIDDAPLEHELSHLSGGWRGTGRSNKSRSIAMWEPEFTPEVEQALASERMRVNAARAAAAPSAAAAAHRSAALLQRVADDVASLGVLTADVEDAARQPLRRASLRTLPSALAEAEAGVRRVDPLAPRSVAECRALIAVDDEIMRTSLFGSRVAAALERRDWQRRDWRP